MTINVALDGPSGAGKSTIARAAAKKLGYVYVDTGAMYRSIALFMLNKGVDLENEGAVAALLPEIDVKLTYENGEQRVLLNGEDVSEKIRTSEVSMAASKTSSYPEVRKFLLGLQKDIASKNSIIMDGRDIGTVILPDAQVKIFLTASAEKRAERRLKELVEKGESISYDEVLADIIKRDEQDMNRETAPLKRADDAILVDTSDLTLEESIDKVYSTVVNNIPKEEKAEKKVSSRDRELMPVRPISKKHKLNFFHVFFYNLLRYIVIGIYHIYYNISYEGVDNVPKDGGNIFASNHRSYQDPVFIALHARVPISYMAKEELFHKNVFFTALIKAFGAFPVVRGSGDTTVIDTSVEKLEKGRNLVIFPEGTRSKDGKVGKGKTGVALVAAVAQTKVVPVGINFEGKLKFRKRVVVRYGKPIEPKELGITSTSPRDLKKIKSEIMENIVDLVH